MPEAAPAAAVRTPSLAGDLVALTKPRIISLLLLTTLAPMFITPAGMPSLRQLLVVAIAGYLMAGGANAINMCFDRDIDDMMARTRIRPIPSGRITPGAALFFGPIARHHRLRTLLEPRQPAERRLALSACCPTSWSTPVAQAHITAEHRDRRRRRRHPAAGGLGRHDRPPDLGALYLFAIIFYWTPPHFWALALNKQCDYGAAHVPMMPIVHGVRETKRQMLLYTLMLIPLTIMPAVIGSRPRLRCGRGCSSASASCSSAGGSPARTVLTATMELYKYSLLYLALLFAAMAVDRWIPSATWDRRRRSPP